MSSPVSIYAEAYVKMHGFDITLGSPSKGDTRYDLTSLRRHEHFTLQLLSSGVYGPSSNWRTG